MIISRPSDNFSDRKSPPTAIIIHAATNDETCHVTIDRDGAMYEHVFFDDKAPHCGPSTLHGVDDVDDFAIGIALSGNSENEPYTDDQIGSLITLCSGLAFEYKISLNRIVGHCHVSQDHQEDPGRDFAWFDFLNVVGARITELAMAV